MSTTPTITTTEFDFTHVAVIPRVVAVPAPVSVELQDARRPRIRAPMECRREVRKHDLQRRDQDHYCGGGWSEAVISADGYHRCASMACGDEIDTTAIGSAEFRLTRMVDTAPFLAALLRFTRRTAAAEQSGVSWNSRGDRCLKSLASGG